MYICKHLYLSNRGTAEDRTVVASKGICWRVRDGNVRSHMDRKGDGKAEEQGGSQTYEKLRVLYRGSPNI